MPIKKRIISIVLTVALIVSMLSMLPPMEVWAKDGDIPVIELLDYEFNGNEFTMNAWITTSGGGIELYGFSYSINGGNLIYEITYESIGKWVKFSHKITVNPGDRIWYEAVVGNEFGLEAKVSSSFVVPEAEKEIGLATPEIYAPGDDEKIYAGEDITFRWDMVAGATGFEWELYKGQSWEGELIDSGTAGLTCKVTIDGELIKGGDYSFCVRAVNEDYISKWESFSVYADIRPEELSVDYDLLVFTPKEGKRSINLVSSHSWEASVGVDWIELSEYSGDGNEEIIVTVEENTGKLRIGIITITSEVGEIKIEVQQNKEEDSVLEIRMTEQIIPAEEGDYDLYVDGNVIGWNISVDEDWLRVSPKHGNRDAIVQILVDENESRQSRTATITVSGEGITRTLTLTQEGRTKMIGDLNDDGKITALDRFWLNRYIAGMEGYRDVEKNIADINGDGIVNAADLEYLSGHLAGLEGYENLRDYDSGNSGCAHMQYTDTYYNTVFVGSTIKTDGQHSYYHVYMRKCACGADLGQVKGNLLTGEHSYDVSGLCACGAYKNESYVSWIGVNISGAIANVYSTPDATGRYGYIHKDEVVTVIGEYGDKYLIEYKLDSGNGVKQGYVSKTAIQEFKSYSIFIDDPYFIDGIENKRFVADYGVNYTIKIYSALTKTYEDCGWNGMVIESSDSDVAIISHDGKLLVKSVGTATLTLKYYGEELDSVTVLGCSDTSIVTTNELMDKATSYAKEEGLVVVPDRVIIFNYNSVYVEDQSWEGGGYYLVTFDAYNHCATAFGVLSYFKDDSICEHELIEGYSGGVLDQMWSGLKNIGDLLNGNLWKGKSESYATKTSVELKVPLGGYIKFASDSQYAFNKNVAEIIVHGIKTGKAFFDLKEYELNSNTFMKKLEELLNKSEAELYLMVMDALFVEGDLDDVVVAVITEFQNAGLTSEQIFRIYLESLTDLPEDTMKKAVEIFVEEGLTKIPLAELIMMGTDAIIEVGTVMCIARDMIQLHRRDGEPFLLIQCAIVP